MYKKIQRIHFIGIGGIGMSAIAEVLSRHGYRVSGSDLGKNESVRHLESLGIQVFQGHAGSHIAGAELVVFSSAILADNPELVAAKQGEIPSIPRAEMLAELMRLKTGIAVAGAHGKTTTTSLISVALVDAGLDPTIIVGGRVDHLGGANARFGRSEFLVAEADESDGSFSKLSPCLAVVTNIDREHMDYYGTMTRLRNRFLSFVNKVPFYGLVVLFGDDPYVKLMRPRITRRKKTFGFGERNDYRIVEYQCTPAGTACEVRIGRERELLRLQIPGRHNALNALATLAVTDELSIPRKQAIESMGNFGGVRRRFQQRGEKGGVTFIDDYAHHPSEITATLSAARERFPQGKVRVIFQPHRFSRVEDLFDRFSSCFKDCDQLCLVDIYPAGEKPIPGIHSEVLAENIERQGSVLVKYCSSQTLALETCLLSAKPGDVILTLGAGDLPNVYKELF